MITNKTLDFLKKISENNDRDWFQANKNLYENSHEEMISFAGNLNELMKKHDLIEDVSAKKSLFRIYRDVRFSKDKSPYKQHWAGSLKRATVWRRGGYYYHIEPGNSMIAAGFWNPSPQDLKLIRSQIAFDPAPIEKINTESEFVKTFGGIEGAKLIKSPKDFSPDHEAIEWLKHKQFIVHKQFTDKEVMDKNFATIVDETFQKVRPFFDYMSEILTTNVNGEPLYK